MPGTNLLRLKTLSASLDRTDLRYEAFFAQSPMLFCIARANGHFARLNGAWEKLLGWTEEEMTDVPWTHFVHPDDLVSTVEMAKKMNTRTGLNTTSIFTNRYLAKDGAYHTINWITSVFINGLSYSVAMPGETNPNV